MARGRPSRSYAAACSGDTPRPARWCCQSPLPASRRSAVRGDLLGRAVVVVGVAGGDELLGHLPVTREPLRLEVGAVGAADARALVPVEPQPAQPVEDAVHHLGRRALDVGVLDAQDEGAAVPAREEPVEERGAGAADVQVAGGGGREADAWGTGGHSLVPSGTGAVVLRASCVVLRALTGRASCCGRRALRRPTCVTS